LDGEEDLANTDPLLGELGDNGGPTPTHALSVASPAIDAGPLAPCPVVDQRGTARPLDGDCDDTARCDIGSYEFDPAEQLDLCDGFDNDCVGGTPDGAAEEWFGDDCDGPDADQCPEGERSCTSGQETCTDQSGPDIEVCGNDLDEDCDGASDENDPGGCRCSDQDADHFADCAGNCTIDGQVCGDCNDAAPSVNPASAELCDGVDNDCDPASADGADEAQNGQSCDGLDGDACLEGVRVCNGVTMRCSDVSPTSFEICDAGGDEDCDGAFNETTGCLRGAEVSDINGSDRVDGFDLVALARAMSSQIGDPGYNPVLDLNGDGWIDGFDLDVLRTFFGDSVP
jgi:hypothetical protein